MKIKANTPKRARRLVKALEAGKVSGEEIRAKAGRLRSQPFAQDAQFVHAAILEAIEEGRTWVSVRVLQSNAQEAIWIGRGFNHTSCDYGWLTVSGW